MILEPLPHDIAISALFSLVDAVYDTTQTITSKEQAIEWTELAHVIGPIDAVSSVLATPFPQLMRRHTVFEFACITLKVIVVFDFHIFPASAEQLQHISVVLPINVF